MHRNDKLSQLAQTQYTQLCKLGLSEIVMGSKLNNNNDNNNLVW